MGVSERLPEALQGHELEKVLSDPVEKTEPLIPEADQSGVAAAEDAIARQAFVHEVVPAVAEVEVKTVAVPASKKVRKSTGLPVSAPKAEAVITVPPDVVEVDSPERNSESLLMLPEPIAPEPEAAWERLLDLPTVAEDAAQDPEADRGIFEQTLHSLESLPLPAAITESEDAPFMAAVSYERKEPVTAHADPLEAQREWVMEIAGEEPGQVFESFMQSLVDLIHEDAGLVADSEEGTLRQLSDAETTKDTEPLPPIVHEVAQKLTDLEPQDRESVAPVVKNLAEAVQEVRLLELGEALPAEIEIAKARVAELVEELFETLGIEYSEEALEQFMAVMLGSNFMLAPSAAIELDLEHSGTHEVKRRFPLLMAAVSDLITPLHRALGTFALTKSSPEMLQELLAGDKVTA